MQAYFEPEQAFSISMPQPVFEILIAYKKKTCIRKAIHAFAHRSLIFEFQQEVLKFNGIYVSWSSPKPNLEIDFLNLEN